MGIVSQASGESGDAQLDLKGFQCTAKEKSSKFSYSNGHKWSLFRNDKS
jgi:hypothetical protein